MPGYVVIEIDVTNPEQYKQYQALARVTMGTYGAKLRARADNPETLEGGWAPRQLIILEFESVEKAKAWYASSEYREAVKAREGAATFRTVVLPGA